MKKLILSLFALLSACASTMPPQEAVAQLEALAPVPARLFQIDLPAGDSGSINVGWWNNGAKVLDPNTWLSQGYDGVVFVGQGVGVTHVRCTSWDGITVAVKQHQGIVQLQNLTLHSGNNQASQFGEQNLAKKLSPKFAARLIDCEVVADPPSSYGGRRPKWLVFGYQCDLYMKNVTLRGREAVEHDVYFHGFASAGALVEDCNFETAGAEGFKVRSDKTETVAVPGTNIIIRRTKFTDWRQDWSWRGGAGIVLQGGASQVLIDRCFFKAGKATAATSWNNKSHAVEIVAEDNSYGGTYGNQHVWIKNCAFWGRSDVDWSNTIIRVARNSGSQMAARSVTIEKCGVYGQRMLVQVSQVPTGNATVRGCNTAEIGAALKSVLDTSIEATIPTSTRRVPVSEGRVW